MKVYFPARADFWFDYAAPARGQTVHEIDDIPVFSGLYDLQGNKLMVRKVRDQAGFVLLKERA